MAFFKKTFHSLCCCCCFGGGLEDGIPARYSMAILAFFGFMFNYMLRINISVAIVAMVNQSAIIPPSPANYSPTYHYADRECGHGFSSFNSSDSEQAEAVSEDGEFLWDEKTQALIVGSFFWGYIVTQLPGGRLSELYGAKYIFGFSILLAGIVNILIPFAAQDDPTYIIVLRTLLGIFEGATYPSMHAMLARWAPPAERSRLTAFIYSGAQAGTIIAFPLAGFLISLWGWKSVFFVMGSGAFVWTLLWMLLAFDNPETHPRISYSERQLLSRNDVPTDRLQSGESIPWKCILTSAPFWAIVVSSICSGWGFWTFLHQLPTYMKNILGFDIKQNSLLSALPYTCMWIFGLVYGFIADRLRQSSCLTTGQIRKISSFFCLFLPGCCILIVTFVGCDPWATVILLTIAIGFTGAKYSAYLTNHIDIAPNFAGTLLGMANAIATVPGWLAPLVAGTITNGQQTLDQWHKVFYISTAVYIFGCVIYCLFASGEVQHWNQLDKQGMSREKEKDAEATGSTITVQTACN